MAEKKGEWARMGENGLETESGIALAYFFPLSLFRTPIYGSVSDLWGRICHHTKESTPYENRQGMRTKNRNLINCSAYPGTLEERCSTSSI